MILGQPVGHPAAAVVAYEQKGFESQLLHDLHLILSHHALGIIQMLWITMRFAAVPVTTKVRRHHCKILCQAGGDLAPHEVRLRIAMEHQQGWAISSLH